MNYRPLGRTGLTVSELAFGGVEIGIPYGIGVSGSQDMPDEASSIALLQSALDQGINFFDTARAYGRSEALIGKAFSGQRERVVLCSKCGQPLPQDGTPVQASQIATTIERSLQDSLSALQTDYLDVYLLHSADLATLANDAIADVFLALKRRGVVRAIGVSTYTVAETALVIDQGIWDVIQLSFNLMDQRQGRLFERAQKNGVGLMVRSVLLKGVLSDKGRNLHPALQGVEAHRQVYQESLDEQKLTLSSLAIKFALSFSAVSAILVGIDRMSYLQQALTTVDGFYFQGEVLSRLQRLGFPDPEFIDLRRWDQMGWLK